VKYFRTSEPWLRGTLTNISPVPRAALHALELAQEDVERWCGTLSDEELNAQPSGLPPVAFHIRHMSRSIDRLLTYAEGHELTGPQLEALKTEADPGATHDSLFSEFQEALERASRRIRAIDATRLEDPRTVGRKNLPASLGGLLVHVAEHTQRHVGQAITTAKILIAARKSAAGS
jgi:uncharacterized damage-inducible protein DinB